jgi:hypothetical protein
MYIPEVLAKWEGQETVPYVALARALGMTRGELDHIVIARVIPMAPKTGGRTVPNRITWDHAVVLVVAAAIAAIAGTAVSGVLRQLVATGAKITPDTVTIPIRGLL